MPERQYWRAGLSRTQKESIEGEFLWSPFKNKNGASNHFYDNMARANADDLIFSFANKKINYVGVYLKKASKLHNQEALAVRRKIGPILVGFSRLNGSS